MAGQALAEDGPGAGISDIFFDAAQNQAHDDQPGEDRRIELDLGRTDAAVLGLAQDEAVAAAHQLHDGKGVCQPAVTSDAEHG